MAYFEVPVFDAGVALRDRDWTLALASPQNLMRHLDPLPVVSESRRPATHLKKGSDP